MNQPQIEMRKVKNFFLQPLLQARIGIYYILLSIGFTIVLFLLVYRDFHEFYQLVLELTDLREEVTEILQEHISGMLGWVLTIFSIFLFATVALSVYFTHHLVGPTYAFRRHISNLCHGNYASRVTLRQKDAFIEVAEDLNHLAETLEEGRRKES